MAQWRSEAGKKKQTKKKKKKKKKKKNNNKRDHDGQTTEIDSQASIF